MKNIVFKQGLVYTTIALVIFSTIAAFAFFREQAVQSGRTWEETRRTMARSYNILRGLRHLESQTLRPDFSDMNFHLSVVREKSDELVILMAEGEGVNTKLRLDAALISAIKGVISNLDRTVPLFQSQFVETAASLEFLLQSIDQELSEIDNPIVAERERKLHQLRNNIVALGNFSQVKLINEWNEADIVTIEDFTTADSELNERIGTQVRAFLGHLRLLKDITESINEIERELSIQGTTLFTAVNDATEAAESKTIPIFALVVVQLLTLAIIFIVKSSRLKQELVYQNNELESLVKLRTEAMEIALEELTESMEHQKKIEEELRLAQRLEAVGQLAAGIAHEINTPSQFVSDNLQFILEAHQDLAKVRTSYADAVTSLASSGAADKVIEDIRDLEDEVDLEFLEEEVPSALKNSLDGMKRISKIVKSMKEFSHPGSEGREFTDLNHSIETTLSVASNEWKYCANLEKALDPELPKVPAFTTELNQVLLNIVVNAAHAIAQKQQDCASEQLGTIFVETAYDKDVVILRIRDTGCGIPQENIDRIFDPFFTTKEVGKGTGQGLSIAHKIIVETHGGSLLVESQVGEYTEFDIRLPRVVPNTGNPAA